MKYSCFLAFEILPGLLEQSQGSKPTVKAHIAFTLEHKQLDHAAVIEEGRTRWQQGLGYVFKDTDQFFVINVDYKPI